jgi:hypothetical protein
MQRIFQMFFFWTLILSACSAIPAAPQTVPAAVTESPLPLPTTAVPDSNPGECGYQWAYQDLPELSSTFQQSIQGLQPEAEANAFAFGENCVRTDGSSTFLPMETDFNITLQVSDLTNETSLGEWVVKVMQVITAIPPELIVGPRPGRVSLMFRSRSKQQGINFYINQFQELPPGLSNAEIFQALKTSQ